MIALIFVLLPSCTDNNKETIKSFKDVRLVPTLRTTNVSTLISDSGITRYRLVAGEWSIFERVSEPYWYFPKGIYVEKFDSVFKVEASIKADSAYFNEGKKLWHLKKNVKIINFQGEKFETQDLYWDQNQQKIYSDSFIKIDQTSKIITGLGFESNESMTRYIIRKTQGIFQVDDNNTQP
ncbi:MAG: LPS export ABC transporter periplasmic protein LptC [Bacteroidales bacterium]